MEYGSAGKRLHQGDDGVERNGKQKKRSNRNEEPSSPLPEETEYRLLCPGEKVGSLIGKGGSIIKTLRQECKSKIKVEDLVPGSEERIVLISSASDQFGQGSQYVCAAQEALFKVYARITEPFNDDDEESAHIVVRLLVPKNHIGCILGKGGKIIEQMRKDIGAQIRILPKEQLPTCASETDELVQVVGDEPTVRRALFAISTRLHENVTGEHSQGGGYMAQGPGMAPMLAAGSVLYPSSGYLAPTGSFYGPSSAGGLGYSFPAYGGMYGDAGIRSLSSGLSEGPAISASGGYALADGASEEQFTVRILCPNSRIGSIIGKAGSVIKKMREETGAKIKVEEEVPDCDERIVRISSAEFGESPSQAIQAALGVYQRLVELQMDKERDNHSFVVRLLVPSNQIGCLLGKGGSIVTEMRRVTKANIRISPKDEPSKCAEEDDELVQIMGDQNVVYDALFQILSRLRSNLFKGQDTRDAGPTYGSSALPYSSSAYSGGAYPLTNVGSRYGYGSYELTRGGSSLPTLSGLGDVKESRRRQR
ncbi:hypothetical protein GOP47_0000442 [Adiantum capillus-veneris]|uniref:K Homology domain-containing protein n=1 Tax=Adiantum capillus-veneris TaxID=13818 RepID=A0A9D4VEZ5_ADICA|nr:hypothetical protein GOP47_0000442 [Adiantum capillus-veneris]